MNENRSNNLTALLAVILFVGVIGLGVIAVFPIDTGEASTEFYVLGPDGDASDYPQNLTVGESSSFIVGVTNHERGEVSYTLVMSEGGATLAEEELTVARGDTWERELNYSPDSPGEKRVQLELYKDSASSGNPYRQLRLVISVTQ
ncbi:DUF1616 domain-containing protein [Salinigranum halophilum]|uniref:DUF1616 domain-containing protein n=1 Tax=Salinigranum halophilum TaxID=2565931 RepID=UPI0010A7BF6C|nr:DUF1616 domain-containing protein [Salinigranum halophilum]